MQPVCHEVLYPWKYVLRNAVILVLEGNLITAQKRTLSNNCFRGYVIGKTDSQHTSDFGLANQ